MKIKWETKKYKYGIYFEWFGEIWNGSFLPSWHKGRGKYISIGFLFIAFYRGY